MKKLKVLHFVTGGFSGGATQVALGLVRAALDSDTCDALLVLRKKSHADRQRIQQLHDEGLPLVEVNNFTHITTIYELMRVCKRYQPDVLVAHGFSEHLWGRYAGLLARVPTLVHVEHNTRERYTWWRLKQAHWLTGYTKVIVGCSEGVRQALLDKGFPAEKCLAIPNGIHLGPFQPEPRPWTERKAELVMVSRIAKQKDHATLIRAIGLLREQGIELPLKIVGKGKAKLTRSLQQLSAELGLEDLVNFVGFSSEVPALLSEAKYFVQCTHYEGMPLTLLEAMAAGCAVIGSEVPGVKEVIAHGDTGLLHAHADARSLAEQLRLLLNDDAAAAAMGRRARAQAFAEHSKELMHQRYEELFLKISASN